MWSKYIVSCILTAIFFLILVIYIISFNNLQFVPIISIFSILIGVFVTGAINLILEGNRLKIKRDKLISSIRTKNAINESIAHALIDGLMSEIAIIDDYEKIAEKENMDIKKILDPFLSLTLYDLEPLDEVMEDLKLLIDEESRLLPIIAVQIKFINRSIEIRQEMINQGISYDVVRLRDENLMHSIKNLRENIRKYEIDIYGTLCVK